MLGQSRPDLSAYAGQWVALVGGQIVGHGRTPDEARSFSQWSRPKERPFVMRVPSPGDRQLPLSPLLDEVRKALRAETPVWLVGGAVRDALLGREAHDLDFAVDGDALALARAAANALGGAYYPLDDERGTGRVIVHRDGERHVLDFARLRGATLAEDLAGRDFTLNAIALPLADLSAVTDPLGGEADLRAKILRACSPTSIQDDPVRGLRAVRLAAQFNLRLEPATRQAVKAEAAHIIRVSPERVRDEFVRALGGRRPAVVVRALDVLGYLACIAPEIVALQGVTQSAPHVYDVWEHTLAVLDKLEAVVHILGPVHDVDAASDLPLALVTGRLGRYRDPISARLAHPISGDRPARLLLMLAALYHDAGKPGTRTEDAEGRVHFYDHESLGADLAARRANHLRLSGDEVRYLRMVVAAHLRPLLLAAQESVSRRAVYRFFRDTGAAGVDVCLLALADQWGTWGTEFRQDEWARLVELEAVLLESFFQRAEQMIAPPLPISGHDLMEHLQIPAGPEIGRLLEAVREAMVEGEVTDRESALAFARRHT